MFLLPPPFFWLILDNSRQFHFFSLIPIYLHLFAGMRKIFSAHSLLQTQDGLSKKDGNIKIPLVASI